ncbi:MAG: sugar phosphate nucleotidyltransferase [Candidatus Bathyarchaeota archaeon]|nr:sugar phosphate nucleotidyltransferase [Candidatus Bathyarchaeota archaeon]
MKAVILAAGVGERLQPLTLTKPKPLLPVCGKPLLSYLLDQLKTLKVKEVYIVVGYLGEHIIKFFGNSEKNGLKLKYVWQKDISGTGDALKILDRLLDEEFVVIYGDLYLADGVLAKIYRAYRKRRSPILAAVEVDNPEDYGVLMVDEDGKVKDLIEKPSQPLSKLVNTGVYVFNQDIFRFLGRVKKSVRGEVELTDAIRFMVNEGHDVYTVKVKSLEWLDIGKPWDLLEANKRHLLSLKLSKIKGKIEENVKISGLVVVEKNVILKSGVYIEGPVYIGEGSTIGPNCYLRAYTSLGKNVKVGSGCEVKNSLIMDNSKIPHLSYVGDSIIGENCNLGAGTLVGNLRFDRKTIRMLLKGKPVDSKREKLGVILGDNVQTGINVSLMPGVRVGPNAQIGPNVCVYQDVPPNTRVLIEQKLKFKSLS